MKKKEIFHQFDKMTEYSKLDNFFNSNVFFPSRAIIYYFFGIESILGDFRRMLIIITITAKSVANHKGPSYEYPILNFQYQVKSFFTQFVIFSSWKPRA